MDDLAHLDATAQAALVRDGEVSARELVEAAIGRVESLNPTLNAVVTTMFEEARATVSGGGLRGPFAGVPSCSRTSGPCMPGCRRARGAGTRNVSSRTTIRGWWPA